MAVTQMLRSNEAGRDVSRSGSEEPHHPNFCREIRTLSTLHPDLYYLVKDLSRFGVIKAHNT